MGIRGLFNMNDLFRWVQKPCLATHFYEMHVKEQVLVTSCFRSAMLLQFFFRIE
jgi:hypothetical protein